MNELPTMHAYIAVTGFYSSKLPGLSDLVVPQIFLCFFYVNSIYLIQLERDSLHL